MKKRIKIIIDVLMTVTLLILMAYQVTGRQFHEYAGAFMLVLFIVHNVLNIRWYKGLFKGHYTPQRIWMTVVNIGLLLCILLQAYSGITMSQYAFWWLPYWGGTATARQIHLAAAYWCFLFIGLHLGNHWGLMIRSMKPGKTFLWILRIAAVMVALIGAVTFAGNGIFSYMTLGSQFYFFDDNEPAVLAFIKIVSMFSMHVFIGYYVQKLLGRLSEEKGRKENQAK